MNATLHAARSYRERGWNPLPLRRDKRPAWHVLEQTRGTNAWGVVREAPADAAELERWWKLDPRAGVGIILEPGHEVVDVDHLDVAGAPRIAGTPTVQTPRPGLHYHVRSEALVRARSFAWGELLGPGTRSPPSSDATAATSAWCSGCSVTRTSRRPRRSTGTTT